MLAHGRAPSISSAPSLASVPYHFDIVIFKLLIDGQDAKPFHLCLGDKHPVEWIAVRPGQCAHRAAMFDSHWQPVYRPRGHVILGALFPPAGNVRTACGLLALIEISHQVAMLTCSSFRMSCNCFAAVALRRSGVIDAHVNAWVSSSSLTLSFSFSRAARPVPCPYTYTPRNHRAVR